MKYVLLPLMFVGSMVLAETMNPHSLPTGAIGILQVDRLTQGELLWLQGRVGEGVYTTTNQAGQHCSIKVPVVVGQIEKSGVGIASVTGLSIIVMNPTLSAALINGERVRSDEWRFSAQKNNSSVDGYITEGIKESEGFVLNSKRRWVSWLLEDKPELHCQ
ncbi:hypothetical protein [Aeromonas cavernicola]|uniref:Uncharacterized protein n=1 Tax=Aeromonas cavernicola TaxID=1006623 RepID=A0A2H9U4L9_9GAMM|nr:hypothetical protein [Aeromonas cavernicola]PJG58970.1 hypothetical protein CUC53_09785 [Aeromonas cavernicola]